MELDDFYLQRCIDLARLGGTWVAPNPMVGCVVVHAGKIIGEGYHEKYGQAHAEVNAILSVKEQNLLSEATLYVSLEPCNHTGKTPPCTELILKHKIPNVVVGCEDPHPLVKGKGIQKLQENGVIVRLAKDPLPFQKLNAIFFHAISHLRPWVTIKWAESCDGFIAEVDENGKPKKTKISGWETQRWVHRLRSAQDSILVGAQTYLTDKPTLNTRLFPGRSPRILIWDPGYKIKKSDLISNQSPPLLLHEKPEQLSNLLKSLYEKEKITSLLVEGGTKTLQAFFDGGLYEAAYKIVNPKSLETGLKGPIHQEKKPIEDLSLGEDSVHKLK